VAGVLVGVGACAAILVGNAAHAAAGVAPVLAWAPLNLVLVAVAFGLAAVVAEVVPRLVEGAPPRVVAGPSASGDRGGAADDCAVLVVRGGVCGPWRSART
jgi:hypothetical protein